MDVMKPLAHSPTPTRVVLALVAVQALFSINYITSKILVDAFPPLVWGSLRLIASGIAMLTITVLTRPERRPKGRGFYLPLMGFALLGVIINQASFMVGIHYTTATNSAILNTLIPIFTLLFVTLRGVEHFTLRKFFGFLSAFVGVLVLRNVEHLSLSDSTVWGDLLMVVNCFSFGLFLAFSKKFLERHDPFWTTTWLFLYGSVGLTLFAIPDYMHFHWPEMTRALLACIAFGILGGTLLTYLLNTWALSRTRSSSVALFIYLQPVFTSALAWVLFHEPITPRMMGASALIFIGMVLGVSRAPVAQPSRR